MYMYTLYHFNILLGNILLDALFTSEDLCHFNILLASARGWKSSVFLFLLSCCFIFLLLVKVVEKLERKCKERAGKLNAHFQVPHAVVRHEGSPDIADLEARLRRAEQELMARDEIREGGQSDKEKVIYQYGPYLYCTSTIRSVLWQFKYIYW